MSAQKFTKKELKQDSFVATTEKVLEFGQRNATVIGGVLLVLVVLLVGGSYLKNSRAAAARDASAMLYQGQTLVAQGDYTAAMGPLQDCIDDHGGSEYSHYARVSLIQAMLALDETETALARIDQFSAEIPADSQAGQDLVQLKAFAMASAGQYVEAAAALEALISRDLDDTTYYQRNVQRVLWLQQAGQHADAVAVLENLEALTDAGEIDQFGNDLENRLAVARALNR